MQTLQSKNIAPAVSNKPFFKRESDGNFFGKNAEPFFKASPIQAKLTVNEPGDIYEKEADAMADQVVQRLSVPTSVAMKPVGAVTPFIQQKECTHCEEDKKLQEEEKDIPVKEQIQKKPIFESNAEPPDDSLSFGEGRGEAIQRKCAECEKEDQKELANKHVQTKPIFESNVEPRDDEKNIQCKCAECEKEEKLQKKEEEKKDEKDLVNGKLQKKRIFESNAEPPNDENNIQKKCEGGERDTHILTKPSGTNEVAAPSSVEASLQSSKGGGSVLPAATRLEMENFFGADFSGVKIHSDSSAVQMNKDLHAQAFTRGNDIYFNAGKYDTESKKGKHLLAHELTHTVQQNGSIQLQKMIQARIIDPHKVMDDIFNDGKGRDLSKVPKKYWDAYKVTGWFKRFEDFLFKCGIKTDLIEEKPLVYMALLYATMSKGNPDWHDGVFTMTATDDLQGSLTIQFKLPKDASGEMATSIYFSSATDWLQYDVKTKVTSGVISTLEALTFTIPDTDISTLQNDFAYTVDAGAYKGNGANFHLTYVLFMPRDPMKLQTVYFNERIDFTLVSKEKLDISFRGKFDIPLNKSIDQKNTGELQKMMPELIAVAVNLESSLGGSHSTGADVETLIFGFSKDKYRIVSLQQFPSLSPDLIFRARDFTYRMLTLLESFSLGQPLVDVQQPPVHISLNTLKEARTQATREDSPGYMIINEESKFVVYFLTSSDLAWLAKKQRGEETGTVKRYVGINIDNMVDLEFFGHSTKESLATRKYLLKVSYFSSRKELEAAAGLPPYYICHRLPDGYYGAFPLEQEKAATSWKTYDAANTITPSTLDVVHLDVQSMTVWTTERGGQRLIIDEDHYEGRKKFAQLYFALKDSNDIGKVATELPKFQDPQVLHYIDNELFRPNSMNPDQMFKEAMKQLSGMGGSALADSIGKRAFALVAGAAEGRGVELMESMLTFMDAIVKDDLVMKAMLMSMKSRDDAEKKELAGIFTSDEDEGKRLITILDNDETMNQFLMGNTIDKLSLDTTLASVTKSRDEIKKSVEERRDLQTAGSMKYEQLFLVQPGEMGNSIREYVYTALKFSLDPKKFPHEDQNSSWFPSPFEENGDKRFNLLEQLYVNEAINIYHTVKTLKTIQTVAMVASVFSLARGAGLWAVARAGLAAGTVKAFLLEALVTSVAAGVMLEGIQVAMGKKFSWKDLGWSIGEAFLMMLVFGWINKLFKLPLTKFTVNAFLFIGYGVGRFYHEHGKMPNGFDFGQIILESVLLMTLLHIGTKITDPFFRRVIGKYATDPRLGAIKANMEKTVKDISVEAAKKGAADKGRINKLGEQYMEYVKQYREWLQKNKDKFTKDEIDKEMAKVDLLEDNWQEAKFIDATGLTQVAQTDTAFYYKPGADSVKALQDRYGKDNVHIDDKTGLGAVKTPEGTFKLVPEDIAKNAAHFNIGGKSVTDLFGSGVRLIDAGIYSMGNGMLETIKAEVLKQPDGKWEALGDNTYSASVGGQRVIFIGEVATTTLDQAIQMETKSKGAGMEFLNKSLSAKAIKGLELLKDGPLKNMSNADVLQYSKNIGETIKKGERPHGPEGEAIEPRPKSFNDYLEKISERGSAEGAELEPIVQDAPKGEQPTQDGKRRIRINEKGECEICASPCDEIRERYKAVMTSKIEADIAKIEKNKKLTDPQKRAKLIPIEQKLADLNNKTAKDITDEIRDGRIKPDTGKWKYARNWKSFVDKKGGRVIEYADGSFDYIRKDGVKVRYSPDGFPDFSPYLNHKSGVKSVDIDGFDERRWPDYEKANIKANHPEWGKDPPDDYSWHHHQNGKTMQLVPFDIHSFFKHAGGISDL